MYARRWSCRCPLRHRDGFLKYLNDTGVTDTARTPGCIGAQVLERDLPDPSDSEASGPGASGPDARVEITLVTYWTSLDAIVAYAGEDIGQARLYPEDAQYEIDPDRHVTHERVLWHHFLNPLIQTR